MKLEAEGRSRRGLRRADFTEHGGEAAPRRPWPSSLEESPSNRKARALRIAKALVKAYPAETALAFGDLFQLLVATILSAQCTDKKVNEVTPGLFARFPDPRSLAEADSAEVERLIKPTGFFRRKARSIQGAARGVVERFGGKVPRTLEEMTTLPGVGRKTANVVLGNGLGLATGVVVDTHVKRLAFRMGLSEEKDPEKIERDLMGLLPESRWVSFGNILIRHGRAVCSAQRPKCPVCQVNCDCPKKGLTWLR